MTSITSRTVLAVGAVAVATLLPTASANAASGTDANTATVSGLATEAALLVATERDLVAVASGSDTSPRVLDRLAAVDREGHAALVELDRLGVDLGPSIRSALDGLHLPDGLGTAPHTDVYASAIDGLRRIASTPSAALPGDTDRSSDRSTRELMIVTLAALALLGMAALVSTHGSATSTAAWSDTLTGLANRRRLDHDLALGGDPELGPTSVIVFDVDHLDAVSTVFGHDTAAVVLHEIGAVVSANVRDHDIVYRSADEEFCVLLVGAEVEDACEIAERVVGAVHAIHLPDGRHITVSAGVAAGHPESVSTTFEIADRAVLEAKLDGCDRVRTAELLSA